MDLIDVESGWKECNVGSGNIDTLSRDSEFSVLLRVA